jgi:hypothetical protein
MKNKIIRKTCCIPLHKICFGLSYISKKINNTKRAAISLAKQLDFPKNSQQYEIFDVDYFLASCERPLKQKSPKDIKEMIGLAISAGGPIKYTYVINGE